MGITSALALVLAHFYPSEVINAKGNQNKTEAEVQNVR